MQQNLNPKEKKRQQQKWARNWRNAFPPAASGCLLLLWLCWPLPGFANLCQLSPLSQRDCLNPVPKLSWNDVTVWNIEKWPTATFCEKTTKASDRKQSDGRNWMEPPPFISLFVTSQSRRVCSHNLRRSTFCYQGAAALLHNNFLWNLFSRR